MKRLWVAAVLVVLALWVGYALGYHHGTRVERTAWEDSQVIELDRDDAPPMIWSKSSGHRLTNRVKIDRKDGLRVYYADPHVTMGYEVVGQPSMNTPDPRNIPLK